MHPRHSTARRGAGIFQSIGERLGCQQRQRDGLIGHQRQRRQIGFDRQAAPWPHRSADHLVDDVADQPVGLDRVQMLGLIEIAIDRGQRRHPVLHRAQHAPRIAVVDQPRLHVDDRSDQLKVVLDPMMNLFQQDGLFRDGCLHRLFVADQDARHVVECLADIGDLGGRVGQHRRRDVTIADRKAAHLPAQFAHMAQHQPEHREIGHCQRRQPQRDGQQERPIARHLEDADPGQPGAPAAHGIDEAGHDRNHGEHPLFAAVGHVAERGLGPVQHVGQRGAAGQVPGQIVARLAGQDISSVIEGDDARPVRAEVHRVGGLQQLVRQPDRDIAQQIAVTIEGLHHLHHGAPGDRSLFDRADEGAGRGDELAERVGLRDVDGRRFGGAGIAGAGAVQRRECGGNIGRAAFDEAAHHIRTATRVREGIQNRGTQRIGRSQSALQQRTFARGSRSSPAQQRNFRTSLGLARQVQVL